MLPIETIYERMKKLDRSRKSILKGELVSLIVLALFWIILSWFGHKVRNDFLERLSTVFPDKETLLLLTALMKYATFAAYIVTLKMLAAALTGILILVVILETKGLTVRRTQLALWDRIKDLELKIGLLEEKARDH